VYYESQEEHAEEPPIFHAESPVKRRKTEDGPHIKVQNKPEDHDHPFLMKSVLDHGIYPPQGGEDLSWSHFTVPFVSTDREYTEGFAELCNMHSDQRVDLRPYMIENPEQCTKFDFLPKLVARFRHFHLRHLIVTNSFTGEPEGIVTRGDLFNYLPL